jgi:peptidoglycan-N-acetylglucosamine deacetylase
MNTAKGTSVPAARATICLTIDFDATSIWFMLGSTQAHSISRGEFGPEVGAPRLLEMMDRMGVPSTWFIPGHTADNYPAICSRVVEAGHEIANHGYVHDNFAGLSDEQSRNAVRMGSDALERLTGQRPKGFRVTGDFPQSLYPILADEGLTYTSNLIGEHFARWARRPDQIGENKRITHGQPLDVVELPLNVTMTDFRHFEINSDPPLPAALVSPRHLEEVWRDEFDFMYERVPGAYLMLCLHPESIGWGGRMLMLERFLSYCGSKPGVRFVQAHVLEAEFRASEVGRNSI